MNGVFITPFIYAELFSPWQKTSRPKALSCSRFYAEFKKSFYQRALVTVEYAQVMLRESQCEARDLCIATHCSDFGAHEESLLQLKSQGALLIALDADLKALLGLKNQSLFDEIVFFARKKIGKEDLVRLAQISQSRLLFSYELSQESVTQMLSLCPERKWHSDYLEVAPQPEMDLWYLPQYQVLHKNEKSKSAFSVVIPFQENQLELLTTLLSLKESFSGRNDFEIVLVDDGFGPDCLGVIETQFSELLQKICYVKLERDRSRARGDSNFRAGVARNIGASLSCGEELIFMDSDILLGNEFWKELENQRQSYSGPLMPRRRQLRADIISQDRTHADFHSAEDTQLSWGGHWEQFYRDWALEEQLWKWTSTYCLCIPRQVFVSLGGFHRAFHCYGFEDTELGYKLHKAGLPIKVMNTDVFHLPISEERSEYKAEPTRKKQILYQSFQVLLRATLDAQLPSLFQHVISKR